MKRMTLFRLAGICDGLVPLESISMMSATTCHGHACFELTHWSVVVLCLCGACAVAAVGYRSRGHYKTMWALEAQDMQLRMERRAKQ